MDVVSVALNLMPAGFVSGLGVASGAAKKFGKDVASDFDNPKKNLSGLGTAGLVAGAAVVAGFGLAIHSTLEFDKSLSELGATVGANGEQMGQLREKALQLGADTAFSASEAAGAMVELGKAGLTTEQIMGGAADATVALAAAGGVDLPQAATIAAAAMNQFHLAASELPHVADLLAGAANASAADVDGLGVALGYVGPVAAAAGLSIDDTTAALALLSAGGLDASTTGTALRSILTNLQPTTDKATKAFDELGLSTEDGGSKFFDASGKILPMNDILDLLRGTFGSLTEQQQLYYADLLFGNQALAAISIMAGTTDESFQGLQDTLANTSAEEVAAEKMNNLAGDLEELGGSLEVALVKGGSAATTALRGLASTATTVVNGFSGLPSLLQGTLVGLTGLVGLGAGIGGIAIKAAELQKSLEKMGTTAQFVGRNMGMIGFAAGGAFAAVTALAYMWGVHQEEQAAAQAITDSYTEALKKQTGAIDDNINANTRKQFADSGIGDILADTTADIGLFADAVRESGTELDNWRGLAAKGEFRVLGLQIQEAADAGDAFARELLRLRDAGELTDPQVAALILGMDGLNDSVDGAHRQTEIANRMIGETGPAAEGAIPGVEGLGGAFEKAAGSTETAKSAFETYQDALKASMDPMYAYQSAVLSNMDSQDKYTGAVLNLIEATRLHGEGSIEAATAQRELERAQIDLSKSAMDTDLAMRALKEGIDNGTISTQTAQATLANWVAQGIVTQAQADAMAWSFGLTAGAVQSIPTDRNTNLTTSGVDSAIAQFHNLAAAIAGATIGGRVTVSGQPGTWYGPGFAPDADNANGGIWGYASGAGMVRQFANGGFEHHVAQFGSGGMSRVWNEPETGGEAYIPLSRSKWPQSRNVWLEAGQQLGMNMSGGGATGTVVTNHFNINLDATRAVVGSPRELARAIAPEIEGELSRRIDAMIGA